MKKLTTFVRFGVLLAAGIMGLSLSTELRVFSLLTMPVAIAGLLLVVYFDWRGRLQRG